MICRYPKVHAAHWVQKDAYDLHGRKWCAGRVVEAGTHETLSRKELTRLIEAVLAVHFATRDRQDAPYYCDEDGKPWPCKTARACGNAGES